MFDTELAFLALSWLVVTGVVSAYMLDFAPRSRIELGRSEFCVPQVVLFQVPS